MFNIYYKCAFIVFLSTSHINYFINCKYSKVKLSRLFQLQPLKNHCRKFRFFYKNKLYREWCPCEDPKLPMV